MEGKSMSIKWIASLRGLFVLLVFFSHELTAIVDRDILLAIGKIGVAGFFLMSGYLAKTSIESRNVKQFLLNRFVRLYPVYWILLFLMVFSALLTHHHVWSVKETLANMTFFHQYMGIENMIGASWMLSIMVIFFVSIVFAVKKNNVNHIYICFALGAIVCGCMRFYFQKPFPTAIFLMSCMGFLGFFYHKYGVCKKCICYLLLFEAVLLVSGCFSYENKIQFYEIAYNGAFLLFFLFDKKNVNVPVLGKLGTLGFTFFLGADIPVYWMHYIMPMLKECFALFFTIHFILCVVFSYLVTKYIEKPFIRRMKNAEKFLS